MVVQSLVVSRVERTARAELSRWVAASLPGSGHRLSAGPTSRSTSRLRHSRIDTRASPALWALLWRQEPGTLVAPS